MIEHEFSPAFADSIAVARSEPVLPHALDEVSADLRRVEEALLAAASNLDEVQPPTPSLDEAHAELITGLREFASALNEAASAATDDPQRLEGRLLELEPPERLIAAAERLEGDGYRLRPLGERLNPARCR